MVAVLLKKEHGYILLLVLLMVCVNTWAVEKVDKARKHYGIHYPQMYAEKGHPFEKEFNCVQRAHQNMLEALPLFLALLFTSSIYRPGVAAICGLVRILGFIVYVHGYSSGDPEKRVWGAFGYLGFLGFLGLTFEGALKFL
ncbi:hypothetical protein Poli38472_006490 [Pythium oligandrum]|uniref:Glutathione S-transferase 3, mitochondrial n=1 Tax=Pythium oligandrum TaxID=41045 RepID=A0A8K1C502_PYTOL|nr:hypothetical protein Poli38472_006490 [Pythium oligandrum]|eukprot:TMW56480.1 hypothetical protein Poli38472_006490 [Pythium oligandrum]